MTVPKVTWSQVGKVTAPGRYMFRFGWLTITEEDLAIWRQFPHATFTLCEIAAGDQGNEFHLGSFDPGATR